MKKKEILVKKLTEALEKSSGKKVILEENKPSNKITFKELKATLHDSGWGTYFKAVTKLGKTLDKYRSVTELPEGVTLKKLEALAKKLDSVALKIESINNSLVSTSLNESKEELKEFGIFQSMDAKTDKARKKIESLIQRNPRLEPKLEEFDSIKKAADRGDEDSAKLLKAIVKHISLNGDLMYKIDHSSKTLKGTAGYGSGSAASAKG